MTTANTPEIPRRAKLLRSDSAIAVAIVAKAIDVAHEESVDHFKLPANARDGSVNSARVLTPARCGAKVSYEEYAELLTFGCTAEQSSRYAPPYNRISTLEFQYFKFRDMGAPTHLQTRPSERMAAGYYYHTNNQSSNKITTVQSTP